MNRKTIIAITIGAVLTILGLFYVFNPVEASMAPKCLFHSLTGWNCPGCGMQRFLHAIMHGRVIEAFQYNYILLVFIPYLIAFGIEQLILTGETQKKWKRVVEGPAIAIFMAILAPSWFILRNILHI